MSELITQAEFARRMDIGRSRVTALKHEGRLVMDGDSVVWPDSRERVLATRNATHDDQSKAAAVQPPPTSEADQEAPLRRIDAQVRKEHLGAELLQIELDERRGKLRRADEIIAAQMSIYTTVRTRLEAIPVIAGPQVAPVADEKQCMAILADHVEMALTELVFEMERMAKQ